MSPNKNKKSPTNDPRKMERCRKRKKYRKDIQQKMLGASLRSDPKEELKELNQLKAAIDNKWSADLYHEKSRIKHGFVFYEEEVIKINESIERCEVAIESARKRALAHAQEEIQMKERGNDCELYPSAIESVITHCQRVDKRYTEGLKEKKCAKENELAVPGAPVPVAAPIPDAVGVAVVVIDLSNEPDDDSDDNNNNNNNETPPRTATTDVNAEIATLRKEIETLKIAATATTTSPVVPPSTDVASPATTTVSAAAAAASSTATIATTTSPVVPPSTDVASPATTTVSAAAAASSTATIMKSDSCVIADDDVADHDDDDFDWGSLSRAFRAYQANKNNNPPPPYYHASNSTESPNSELKHPPALKQTSPPASNSTESPNSELKHPPAVEQTSPPASTLALMIPVLETTKIAATATTATQVGAIEAPVVIEDPVVIEHPVVEDPVIEDQAVEVSGPAPAVAASTAAGSADSDVGVEKDQPWKGFRVVFTGSIDRLNRSKAKCIAEQLGAESFPRSVSKSTDLLVSGKNGGEKGSQAEAKAQKLGVTILTSNDFLYAATISKTCTLSWNERAKTFETEYPPYNSDFYNNRNGN
ncbi:hypothetical protein FRACYDRAFT_246100 [Fragilariopsis cylindrus CCMP1102]|uniref:BRCT domain-containing protein n=1 Tax=Fragilariopsis cylindrus CCMP1102 TaxID=635003 RepID=A0A1E7EYU9_9STRA|nr:hypothetical protein FRACYDRAFT_246100 [Fragilariopsis cylindrus CCMP1102]|eukprot:OEU10999.1 hypothetical protein FRACYDRAFT_246100 [Fragilariopsis cylindrus CCMP1102]